MPESFKRFNTVFSSGWIDIGTSWGVNEVMSRSQKLQIERSLMTGDGFGCGIVFQTLLKDAFDAVYIEQFEPQRALAGGIEPCGCRSVRPGRAASGPSGAGSRETHPTVIDR